MGNNNLLYLVLNMEIDCIDQVPVFFHKIKQLNVFGFGLRNICRLSILSMKIEYFDKSRLQIEMKILVPYLTIKHQSVLRFITINNKKNSMEKTQIGMCWLAGERLKN